MMPTNILQSLLGTINGIYLGQMIGVDALAAVSAFFPMMFFFISFIIGLGAGARVLIGQAWGRAAIEVPSAILLGGIWTVYPDYVQLHVPPADELLPAGMAQTRHQTPDLKQGMIIVIIMRMDEASQLRHYGRAKEKPIGRPS